MYKYLKICRKPCENFKHWDKISSKLWLPFRCNTHKNVCGKAGVQVQLNGNSTIKDLFVAPKDKDNITNKGGVIYRYKCDHLGCTMEYICEIGRTFRDRYKEHLRASSPIYDHANTTGHSIKLDSFSIVDRESQGIIRTIKEAIFIRVNDP